jgi:hypothetical protein
LTGFPFLLYKIPGKKPKPGCEVLEIHFAQPLQMRSYILNRIGLAFQLKTVLIVCRQSFKSTILDIGKFFKSKPMVEETNIN